MSADLTPVPSLYLASTPALVKAIWGVAIVLAGLATSIFWAGVSWNKFDGRIERVEKKLEQIDKKTSSLAALSGTETKNAPIGSSITDCPKGYVVVGIRPGGGATDIHCGLLIDPSQK